MALATYKWDQTFNLIQQQSGKKMPLNSQNTLCINVIALLSILTALVVQPFHKLYLFIMLILIINICYLSSQFDLICTLTLIELRPKKQLQKRKRVLSITKTMQFSFVPKLQSNKNGKETKDPENKNEDKQKQSKVTSEKIIQQGQQKVEKKDEPKVFKKSIDNRKPKNSYLQTVYPLGGERTDAHLIEMLEKQVVNTCPNLTFDEIAELDKAKGILAEAVLLPLMMPHLFKGLRRAWKGVLLFGPPGTGKTLLAKAIASGGKTTFFNVTASSLASKWVGESQKLVRILFEMAEYYSPTTIFIDQIDSLASKRQSSDQETSRKVKTELMARMDGISGGDQTKIVVIGASNCPWDIDDAIRRRLEKRIYIPLPDEIGRRELLRIILKDEKLTEEIDLESIVKKTEGLSGADIANFCREAAYMTMRKKLLRGKEIGKKLNSIEWMRNFEKQVSVPLTMDDFEEALKSTKPSVGKEALKKYDTWMQEFGQEGT